MVTKERDIVILSKKEAEGFINRECQKRLGMSYVEYMEKRPRVLSKKPIAAHDIDMLLKILER